MLCGSRSLQRLGDAICKTLSSRPLERMVEGRLCRYIVRRSFDSKRVLTS